MTAVDVERVLGEGSRADFHDHGREFARRMIILLHGVDDALGGGEIDGAPTGDGESCGATLGGVFAFAFDGDFLLTEDVELALRVGLLIDLAAFGGRGDRVKNTALSDTDFDMFGHQLVAITSDADAGIFGPGAGWLAGLWCISRSNLWHRTHNQKE